ncbi:hypothetical protein DOTSEDRAFT_70058 [Dothistroma septosporum NZE10]|uniref:TLC domain-containing protein n=1 Tax=Dothistroma septosporum (strain NZE10 / CBS 128990) TaxID=675120 RepID=N1PSJ8_DOTSN|nr:hypothetical protein DOTSEDRAFT_70058 [Dothistroma septosporum NZE10]
MKDPFPIAPPKALIELVKPIADPLGLPSLALHAHEVLFAFGLYIFIDTVVSPVLSSRLVPDTYNKLNKRTRLNWDVHVVSFFQSVLISALSLYVIFYDEERASLRPRGRWEERIWEYTGVSGLCQSFALGYFMWDFYKCAWHLDIFGWGMLAHAISAFSVFALGYRPFIYFYAPIFLLYELSSPFLNIHWFCDKLELTGSIYQAINGAFLTGTFFACRLVWGNISSFWVFYDIFHAIQSGSTTISNNETGAPKHYSADDLLSIYGDEQGQRLAFAGGYKVPIWLGLVYLTSNLVLNSLNIFWFGKMLATIRKRFDPPLGTKGVGEEYSGYEPKEKVKKEKAYNTSTAQRLDPSAGQITNSSGKGSVRAARERAEAAMDGAIASSEDIDSQRVTLADGSKGIQIEGQRTLRTRRKA